MADEPQQQPEDRADFVKLKVAPSAEPLSFFGTGRQAFQRVLQTLSGMQDVSGVSVAIERSVVLGGLIVDATREPFRVNGRKWSMAFNLAAPGATSNIVRLQAPLGQQPKNGVALVTVDEIRYQGPSVCAVRPAWAPAIAEMAPGPARDLETEISKGANVAEKNVTPYISAVSLTGGLGTGTAIAFLGNVAAGSTPEIYRPEGLVIWPAELLELIQQTQNVVMTVTISGRVWIFSSQPA